MGSTRPRHDGDVRSKRERGVAVDDGARGAGGMAVDGSMGAQRAHSSGDGIWAKTGDAVGTVTSDGGDMGTAARGMEAVMVGTATRGMEAVTGGVAMDRASGVLGHTWVRGAQGPQTGMRTKTCGPHGTGGLDLLLQYQNERRTRKRDGGVHMRMPHH